MSTSTLFLLFITPSPVFKNTEPNFSHDHNQIHTQPNIPTLNLITLFLINVCYLVCQCPVHNTLKLDNLISLTPPCLALLPTISSPTSLLPRALFGSLPARKIIVGHWASHTVVCWLVVESSGVDAWLSGPIPVHHLYQKSPFPLNFSFTRVKLLYSK